MRLTTSDILNSALLRTLQINIVCICVSSYSLVEEYKMTHWTKWHTCLSYTWHWPYQKRCYWVQSKFCSISSWFTNNVLSSPVLLTCSIHTCTPIWNATSFAWSRANAYVNILMHFVNHLKLLFGVYSYVCGTVKYIYIHSLFKIATEP